MYSGVTADSTEVFASFFLNCVFSPLIYTRITLSLNNKDTIMKKEDNKVVIVDTGYLSVFIFSRWQLENETGISGIFEIVG